MGDIADMMLDGTLCQICGVYLGKDTGYPISCEACEACYRSEKEIKYLNSQPSRPNICNLCNKRLSTKTGLKQHKKDKHGVNNGRF